MEEFKEIQILSRIAAILAIGGVVIVTFFLMYSFVQNSSLEKSIESKIAAINELAIKEKEYKLRLSEFESQIDKFRKEERDYRIETENNKKDLDEIRTKVIGLRRTEQSLLDFLVAVTDSQKISLLDPSVSWGNVKHQIEDMPAGKRKNAMLNAILLAWKDIPFVMGGDGVRGGFDSPRFLRFVLSTVGVLIAERSGEQLSVTLMNQFKKTDNPRLGDLVFFRGQVGYFGFILVSIGRTFPEHVGVGTLQKTAPLQVVCLGSINTPDFPLEGYYRVSYPGE